MGNNINSRLSSKEYKYVKEVLDENFKTSSGSIMMNRFETAFSDKHDTEYGISFVNGTATMHAALEAMGIGEGDEVIVPPLTMAATTFAVLQANATPVFADIDPDTFQIDGSSIRKCVTKKTKAIITVALYGLSPDMDPIMDIARENRIKVIEDNAQCFLGKYNGRLVGTIGDCSSYSFQSSKHLTSGEGGIILTNDKDLAEEIRKVQSLGYAGVSATQGKITKLDIQDPGYSRHVTMGWNYRMPELCCAVALAQTENIEVLVKRRQDVAKIFEEATMEYHHWFRPQYVGKNYTSSYWAWVTCLKTTKVTWHEVRDKFIDNGGDGVYAAWKLTYLEPLFETLNLLNREKYISEDNIEKYKRGLCPEAEQVQPNIFQFKTNYWDIGDAYKQADILKRTLMSIEQEKSI
jgi:perosamine synthetase